MSNEQQPLKAVELANFDWTMHLQSVWNDLPYHVPGLHEAVEREFLSKLHQLQQTRPASASPLGWVIAGAGGVGKTHLLSTMRGEAFRSRAVFIMVDMTDVNDFWETVAAGFISSLQERNGDGQPQQLFIVENLIRLYSKPSSFEQNRELVLNAKRPTLVKSCNGLLMAMAKHCRQEAIRFQDAIRALFAVNSNDFEIASLGQMWLQGLSLEPDDAKSLGLTQAQQRPIDIVRAISWLTSLGSPAVVAFDQLDPIVCQLEYEVHVNQSSGDQEQEAIANSVISGIGDGLRALFDVTRRTLNILSCLESSWDILSKRVLASSCDRFETPRLLRHIDQGAKVRTLVAGRMQLACQEAGFTPPYPTWPFSEVALDRLSGVTPRELLKRCAAHRRACLESQRIIDFDDQPAQPSTSSTAKIANQQSQLERLDSRFAELWREADLSALWQDENEYEKIGTLIQNGCRQLLQELQLPDNVDGIVDTEFAGGRSTKPLHARVRLIFRAEDEREEHFCLRVLQQTHASAFQSRLKLAITQSGIDPSLRFRRLVVVRTTDLPQGPVTESLLKKFREAGGIFVEPQDSEIRTLYALKVLADSKPASWEQWLQTRLHATNLAIFRDGLAGLFQFENKNIGAKSLSEKGSDPLGQRINCDENSLLPKGQTSFRAGESDAVSRPIEAAQPFELDAEKFRAKLSGEQKPAVSQNKVPNTAVSPDSTSFPLGRRFIGGKASNLLAMPLQLLEKHAVVLAGAGSGKTVLLKRMIEEAALRGIPSIIIDGANDLSALGDRWPEPPEAWSNEDRNLSEQYHECSEVVVWTPGKLTGNELRLELIPNLDGIQQDRDELDSAVAMVSGAMSELLKLGNGKQDQNKKGILSKALRYYIENGHHGLLGFIDLLADLPAEAHMGINKESQLARDLSDSLRVLEETDPMVSARESGESLDPAVLFGDHRLHNQSLLDQHGDRRTRVSVINLGFLPTPESQQRFVNQLATTLFAWIKRYPNPPNRSLRGLLVIDEAKDFVPGLKSTACKDSLMRLTAQARKYHLGVIYATQNPREIENTIIGNCSTQFYGKANSPAAIATIQEQLATRGGSGGDIGRLERGSFYVFNADAGMKAPAKVQVPLCLSKHHTLDRDQVLARARAQKSSPPPVLESTMTIAAVPSLY